MKSTKTVWHVSRFQERFELDDDQRFCRKGPLVFCKDYVTANDDESATYLRQMDALTRHRNALELIGAWLLIRRAVCARSRAFRGYLLTADSRPMSDAEIGRTILFCDPRRAARILKALAEAGLIEQVICPIFDLSQNEAPKKKRAKSPRKPATSAKQKTGCRDSVSRKTSRKSEDSRTPLRAKKENGRVITKEITTGTPERREQGQRSQQGSTQGDATRAPTTAPQPESDNPNESEVGQNAGHCTPGRSAPSLFRDRPPAVPIGHCLKIHDADTDAFGLEVFRILGLDARYDPMAKDGKSEWRSFAQWLIKAKAQTPPSLWPILRQKGLDKAHHLRRNGGSAEEPGAVWHKIMAGVLRAHAPAQGRKLCGT